MIKINLLPEEFREHEKRPQKIPAVKIAVALAAIFVVLSVVFYFDFLISYARLRKIEQEWKALQPRSEELTRLQQEVEGVLKPERNFFERYVVLARPLTSLMMWISEFLPDMVWIIELKMEAASDGASLFLKGLALPSKSRSSIDQIETYLHFLKGKIPEARLNLTTTRQKIENVELTQFMASFDWGEKPKGLNLSNC